MLKPSVFFAVPAYRGLKCIPMIDALEATLKACEANGHRTHLAIIEGDCYIQTARNELVARFMESGCDQMFFLDDDISWPVDAALKLIGMEDLIVAGVYPTKTDTPHYPVVIHCFGENHLPVVRKADGSISASRVATGFLRIKREAIQTLQDNCPQQRYTNFTERGEIKDTRWDLFPQGLIQVDAETKRWQGEDFAFCKLWTDLLGEIWVVPDIDFIHHGKMPFPGNYHQFLMEQPGGVNASRELKPEYPETQIVGWTTPAELQWLHERAHGMAEVVEIGSWKGRSAHAIATAGPRRVYCVDTFDGAGNKKTQSMAAEEDVFSAFLKNIAGLENITPMRMTGDQAAEVVDAADMVFIDADHSYAAVKTDILTWRPKARRLLCGHDYDLYAWPGVVQAVDEIFGNRVKVFESIWYVNMEEAT